MLTTIQLDDIQANILKGHGREHQLCLFIQFKPGVPPTAVRDWITLTALRVTSASDSIHAAQAYKAALRHGESGDIGKETVTTFCLSASGYRRLGYSKDEMPSDPSFRLGMKDGLVNGKLFDPPSFFWEPCYRDSIDVMLLLANKSEEELKREHDEIALGLTDIGSILFTESSNVLLAEGTAADSRKYVEHFGYQDGISNPKFEYDENGNLSSGDIDMVLAADSFGCFGTYVVFRKLEQNVLAFNRQVSALSSTLGIDEELVKAQVVGRFRDGTPLEKSVKEGLGQEDEFDFENDPKGSRCPFHAHIRKVRPRVKTLSFNVEKGKPEVLEPAAISLVRRGMTYGHRAADLSDEPAHGVGLLFMSCQKSIQHQFEQIQGWCNDEHFLSPKFINGDAAGIDPIIGQNPIASQPQKWNTTWLDGITGELHDLRQNGDGAQSSASEENPANQTVFKGVVKLMGGEYFYAPPISFLRNLPSPAPRTDTAPATNPRYTGFDRPLVGSIGLYPIKSLSYPSKK